MKDSVMFLVIVFLAIVASGCAKQPSSDVRVVKRGSLECKVVKVYDPTSRSYVEEDTCNTEYGLRGRVGMRAGYPVVLASPAEAALMTATHNPAAQRCQKFVIEMSDGSTREEEECLPADARVITRMPARSPVNLGTTSKR
ncbi:MAG: hypothetical protein BWY14_00988 [Parcubacteria group bacterium ADurb.Bin192]|nr:MAG: hypothetical protein BWY14_00988 [Parcubacteria group bacterium ADurb.Bin192]